MHDIDRTLMESDPEAEYEPELESDYEYGEFQASDTEAVFDEAEEMELAAELLGISDEAELDQFLGKLNKSVTKKVRGVINSPVGKPLGGILNPMSRNSVQCHWLPPTRLYIFS